MQNKIHTVNRNFTKQTAYLIEKKPQILENFF